MKEDTKEDVKEAGKGVTIALVVLVVVSIVVGATYFIPALFLAFLGVAILVSRYVQNRRPREPGE